MTEQPRGKDGKGWDFCWERMIICLSEITKKKKNTRTLSFLQKFGQETFILLNGDYDHDDSIM